MKQSLSHIAYIKSLKVKLKVYYHHIYKSNLILLYSPKLPQESLNL